VSRLAKLDPNKLTDAQRDALDQIAALREPRPASEEDSGDGVYKGIGQVAGRDGVPSLNGPYNAWLRSPELGLKLMEIGTALRFSTTLTPRTTELAILITGRDWTAQFEWWAHERFARRAGIEDKIIETIRKRARPELSDPTDRAVYDFCTELIETRKVGDATYAAAVAALGEAGVMELITLTGFYGLVSMTLNTFQVPLPKGVDPPLR